MKYVLMTSQRIKPEEVRRYAMKLLLFMQTPPDDSGTGLFCVDGERLLVGMIIS